MINKSNGRFTLTDSIELKPNSGFDWIESEHLGEIQETRDMGNGHKWLDIKNIKNADTYITVSLCFKEGKLSELSMVLDHHPFDLNSSWDAWNEIEEKEKLKKYQAWLNNELDNQNEFSWGEARANYDPKSCSTSIVVRYK